MPLSALTLMLTDGTLVVGFDDAVEALVRGRLDAVDDERARLATEVRRLRHQCHSRSGLMCDDHPCEQVDAAAVLALLGAAS